MCTERSYLHRNRRQTVRANRSVLVFPRFWKLKLRPKELYDPIADVLANGAFAGNETNGTAPSSLLYKRRLLRSFVRSFIQPSFGFVLETLNGRNPRRTIPREVGSILPWKRIKHQRMVRISWIFSTFEFPNCCFLSRNANRYSMCSINISKFVARVIEYCFL